MKVNLAELSQIIQKELETYESQLEIDEVGTVLEVGDGIARVSGLTNAMSAEMVEFENGIEGIVFNLEQETVGVVVLGDYLKIKEGFQVKRLKKLLSVPVGETLLGRVVDPLGNPLDDMGPVRCNERRFIESSAPGIADRQPIKVPLQTGIKAIDAMVPIGRGQRELIIGDRKTGKTAIAIDSIINQKDLDQERCAAEVKNKRMHREPCRRVRAHSHQRQGNRQAETERHADGGQLDGDKSAADQFGQIVPYDGKVHELQAF